VSQPGKFLTKLNDNATFLVAPLAAFDKARATHGERREKMSLREWHSTTVIIDPNRDIILETKTGKKENIWATLKLPLSKEIKLVIV